jgi:hypothetical protein
MSALRLCGPSQLSRRALINREQTRARADRAVIADRLPELAAVRESIRLAELDTERAIAAERARVQLAEIDARERARADQRYRDLVAKLDRAVERGEISGKRAAQLLRMRAAKDDGETMQTLLRGVSTSAAGVSESTAAAQLDALAGGGR